MRKLIFLTLIPLIGFGQKSIRFDVQTSMFGNFKGKVVITDGEVISKDTIQPEPKQGSHVTFQQFIGINGNIAMADDLTLKGDNLRSLAAIFNTNRSFYLIEHDLHGKQLTLIAIPLIRT